MNCVHALLIGLALIASLALAPHKTLAQSYPSTRISDVNQHRRQGDKRNPHRAKSDYILNELDLQEGDVVVDVGAGDGWWAEKFAKSVGESGTVYAAEVAETMVAKMKKKFASVPQIMPYLIETDSTGLPEDSCDVAFFSQSYHHLDKDGHVDYLKHLHSVLKPTGRVVIIERYTETGLGSGVHGTRLSRLVRQAEEAAWVPVRLELMTGTYHYIAILAQQELFPPEPRRRRNSRESKPTEKLEKSESE
jgi:ubiquinone/menaquinone biosynthesis C-methylase UbiE